MAMSVSATITAAVLAFLHGSVPATGLLVWPPSAAVRTAHSVQSSPSTTTVHSSNGTPTLTSAGHVGVDGSIFQRSFVCQDGVGERPSCRRGQRQGVAVTMNVSYNPNDELRAIVERKQYEVKQMLKQHASNDDPLQMRLRYGNSKGCYDFRRALRRNKGPEDYHMTLVIADLKRRSPTSAELPPDVTSYDDAAEWASQVHDAGAGVLMVNTDGPAWGGRMTDLEKVVAHFKKKDGPRPPIIMKDMIVHPIQMAQALEKGAAGTILIACVLGPALRDFMDTATIMGTECIVEVHTPAECEKALEHGACVIMVNNWDRITGKLYPKQAMALRHMIPDEVLTIAAGGITSKQQAAELSDEGYDAVVLGRSLVTGGGGAVGGDSGPELIRGIYGRVGVPRPMLGWGVAAEDLDVKKGR